MQAVLGKFSFLKPHVHNWGFPGGSVVKNSPADAGGTDLIPGSRRSPEEGNSNPPVFLPGKSHGQGACWATVHGVTKGQTQLGD